MTIVLQMMWFASCRMQLRYGKRWGPIHPDYQPSHPMDDDHLVANYTFAEGEYISEMDLYYGVGIDGFTMTTNVQTYPHIRGTGGWAHTAATGQWLLFISGEVHEYFGNHQLSRVRFYLTPAELSSSSPMLIFMYKIYVYSFPTILILSTTCKRFRNPYAPRPMY